MRHKQFVMSYKGADPSPYYIWLRDVSIVDGAVLKSDAIDLKGRPFNPASKDWLKLRRYVKIGEYCYRNEKKLPSSNLDIYIHIIPETDPAFNIDILLNELYRTVRKWSPKDGLNLTRLLEVYLPDFVQEADD